MLWLLITLLYVQTGFQLGKKAAKTWKKRDSKSLESFLLFPVNHARGKVGKDCLPFMGGVNPAEATFRTLVTLGWPVMIAWNTLVILVLGPDKILRRLTAGPPTYHEQIKKILAEERRVDRVLKALEDGEGTVKRPRRKKAKALPAPADETATPLQPGISLDLLEMATPAGLYEPPPPATAAEKNPSQVQVRVTVDVTASGPAVGTADRGDEQREAPPANAASKEFMH